MVEINTITFASLRLCVILSDRAFNQMLHDIARVDRLVFGIG